MLVKITQDVIDKTKDKRCVPRECAVAVGIHQATGNKTSVGRFGEKQYVYYFTEIHDSEVIHFHQNVSDIIAKFDKTGEMEPFEFEING